MPPNAAIRRLAPSRPIKPTRSVSNEPRPPRGSSIGRCAAPLAASAPAAPLARLPPAAGGGLIPGAKAGPGLAEEVRAGPDLSKPAWLSGGSEFPRRVIGPYASITLPPGRLPRRARDRADRRRDY